MTSLNMDEPRDGVSSKCFLYSAMISSFRRKLDTNSSSSSTRSSDSRMAFATLTSRTSSFSEGHMNDLADIKSWLSFKAVSSSSPLAVSMTFVFSSVVLKTLAAAPSSTGESLAVA